MDKAMLIDKYFCKHNGYIVGQGFPLSTRHSRAEPMVLIPRLSLGTRDAEPEVSLANEGLKIVVVGFIRHLFSGNFGSLVEKDCSCLIHQACPMNWATTILKNLAKRIVNLFLPKYVVFVRNTWLKK